MLQLLIYNLTKLYKIHSVKLYLNIETVYTFILLVDLFVRWSLAVFLIHVILQAHPPQ
jgi:hypothetical protein